MFFFFFSSRRRHTRLQGDWSSDVCSSDLWMDGAPITFDEALDVMLELRDKGRIQRIGLSNVTGEQLDTALTRTAVASVSNQFGPTQQGDAATLARCEAEGIAYLPFFPLAAGRVAKQTGEALAA